MTTPQSEVKKCSCKNPFEIPEGIFGFIGEGKCSRCGLPILPTVKESPLSQCCKCEKPDLCDFSHCKGNCHTCGLPIRPVSQSVEGWEKRFSEKWRKPIANIAQWEMVVEAMKEDIKHEISTLVKEMEGLYKITPEATDFNVLRELDGFNAGISAAVEVINRLNK